MPRLPHRSDQAWISSFQSEQMALLTCSHHSPAQVWLWLWPLSAQPQIQTYQVLQEHLAPSTSTAALGPVNQCKSMGAREVIPSSVFKRCVFFLSPCFAELVDYFLHLHSFELKLIPEAALLPDLGLSVSGFSMPSEGELAPFTTSSDNNDDSRGLNCTV